MKKTLNLFVLAVVLVAAQACGPKSDKTSETTEVPSVKAATVVKPTLEERRAKIEKARMERAEARRIALEERYKLSPSFIDADGNVVFNKAEVQPSFVGGDDAMSKFLNDNIQYPKDAQDAGLEGTVWVDFVVATDGSVRQVTATDGPSEDVDQSLRMEAMRVVSSMPKWTPGRQRGKAVHVSYSVPITFQLN